MAVSIGTSQEGAESMSNVRAFLWALTGSAVVLFIFFAAVGGIDPAEAWIATVVVAVLAVLWILHARSRLFGNSDASSQTDRERRGF